MTDGKEKAPPAEERLSLVLFILERHAIAMRNEGFLDDCSEASHQSTASAQ